MKLLHLLLIAYLAINVITFIVYGIDKWKARRDKWRIPESTLLLLAALYGSLGAWLGMKVWHHKTMHKKFRFCVPLFFVLQVLAVLAILIIRDK